MTLIEMTVTIAVVAIMGMGLSSMVLVATKGQALAINVGDAQDAGTLAVDKMALEIREMQAPPSLGLVAMSPTIVDFRNWQGTEIQYYMNAGTLTRLQVGGTPQPLADGVANFVVTYRGADGSAATSAYLVARIDYDFDVTRGTETLHFGGQIQPRAFDPTLANWREE